MTPKATDINRNANIDRIIHLVSTIHTDGSKYSDARIDRAVKLLERLKAPHKGGQL